MIRSLTSIVPPALTAAQRDAIPAGRRPPGAVIWNQDANRPEHNVGTDAAPVWQPFGLVTGVLYLWPYGYAQAPPGLERCDGTTLSRVTFARLHALAQASGYPHGTGDGATTFTKPDYRGRHLLGLDDMGSGAAGRVTAASGAAATTLGATGGAETVALTAAQIPSHLHQIPFVTGNTPSNITDGSIVTGGSTSGASAYGGQQTAAAGGGGAHSNMAPWAACHILIAT